MMAVASGRITKFRVHINNKALLIERYFLKKINIDYDITDIKTLLRFYLFIKR